VLKAPFCNEAAAMTGGSARASARVIFKFTDLALHAMVAAWDDTTRAANIAAVGFMWFIYVFIGIFGLSKESYIGAAPCGGKVILEKIPCHDKTSSKRSHSYRNLSRWITSFVADLSDKGGEAILPRIKICGFAEIK
jgi:hypothetical protein